MLQRIEDQPQYESFEACVKDLKARYRRTHPGEKEGLHYQFNVQCLPDGRSGFIKAERLEISQTHPNARTEDLLIEDNRVVGHETEEQPPEGQQPSRWLE